MLLIGLYPVLSRNPIPAYFHVPRYPWLGRFSTPTLFPSSRGFFFALQLGSPYFHIQYLPSFAQVLALYYYDIC